MTKKIRHNLAQSCPYCTAGPHYSCGHVQAAAPQQEAQERVPSAAGADDLQETLDRLDSKELAAWVDRGMALAENVAMYVQADCTLRAGQARDILRGHLFSAQPSPTPQADSQSAPQGETNAQLDTDSNNSTPGQQRDVAGTVALGQPVGNGEDQAASHLGTQGDKLLIVAERNIRSFLRSAVFKSESDREAALNCVDVLWEAARAPADSVTAPAGGVDDDVDAIALARYKVVPAHESMFHRFAVVAGDGKQQLYLGREVECENMARKFAGAFLDGAFYQSNIAPTPPTQAADSVLEDAAFEAVRKKLCALPRYSFVLDYDGLIRRVQDRTGNWIEFDAAHELFDPVAVDAARKQGGAA